MDLYDATVGEKPYSISSSRLRYFGGTTNHWGGWCRPLDEIDFVPKKHAPLTGWPIKYHDLLDYYSRAAEICEINNFQNYSDFPGKIENLLDLQQTSFENKFFVFSPPTRFGKAYRSNINESDYIDCYLNTNAAKLSVNNSEVNGIEVKRLNAESSFVSSRIVILSMGGLENPRFLPVISLKEAVIKEQELNNICIFLKPRATDELMPASYYNNNDIFWSSDKYTGANYEAVLGIEPTPNRESRIVLTDKLDLLGMPKLKLDWKFNPEDFIKVEKTLSLLSHEFGLQGMGKIKYTNKFDQENIAQISGGMHHMGTTRMAANTDSGVVDTNCELFDTKGLFMAGSSVFPSVGFSSPTLTIVALALRLANYIEQTI